MISEQEQVFDMKKSTSITKSFCMSLLIRGSYKTDKWWHMGVQKLATKNECNYRTYLFPKSFYKVRAKSTSFVRKSIFDEKTIPELLPPKLGYDYLFLIHQ